MGQDLVIICHRCKKVTWFMCRFYNIKKKDVQEYFYQHKGHDIKVCGDDGGWDITIADFNEKGYKNEYFGSDNKSYDNQEDKEIEEGLEKTFDDLRKVV